MGTWGRIGRVWKAGLLVAVGAAGGAAAVAVASVPDSNGVIHACYEVASPGSTVPAATNSLRIIDPSAGQACNTVGVGAPGTEASVAWNQSGPQGPQGPAGPAGQAGKSTTIAGGNTFTIGGSVVTVGASSGLTVTLPPVSPNSKPVGTATVSGLGSFNILSVSLGSSATGAGVGRANIHELVVNKTTDKASPLLFRACAAGQHFKKVVLSMRKAGKVYLQYTLSNVLVSSYQQSGHGTAKPTETVSFSYGRLAITYMQQNA